MNRIVFLTVIVLLFCGGCKTEKETILNTASKVINTIRDDNPKAFRSLIVHQDLGVIGKDDEMVTSDVRDYHVLFSRYLRNRTPVMQITNLYNKLGQLLVKVPICDTINDSIMTNVKKMHLDILFGPPSLFPLNRITGYELVVNDQDSARFKPYAYWKERGVAK